MHTRHAHILIQLTPALAALFTPICLLGQPTLNPTNGHYYERVDVLGGIDWYSAEQAAAQMQFNGTAGHLATITTANENEFIVQNLGEAAIRNKWLGGYQSSRQQGAATGWKWVTGEPWSYTNWDRFEPNEWEPGEDGLHFKWTSTGATLGTWNDLDRDRTRFGSKVLDGYVVEFEPTPFSFQAPFYADTPHILTQTTGHGPVDQFAIDLSAGFVEVLAALPGTAHAYPFETTSPYGNYVTIHHGTSPSGEEIFTLYAHLQEITVESGQKVAGDEIIGIQGATGTNPKISGVHLHFDVRSGDYSKFSGSAATHPSKELTDNFGTITFANQQKELTKYTSSELAPLVAKDPKLPKTKLYSHRPRPRAVLRTGSVSQSVRHNFAADSTTPLVGYELNWPGNGVLSLEVFQPDGKRYSEAQDVNGIIAGVLPVDIHGVWSFKISSLLGGSHDYTLDLVSHLDGDFNGDATKNALDIDLLFQGRGTDNHSLDINGDGIVDDSDVKELVETQIGSQFGDANLDLHVDFLDFVALSSSFNAIGGWSKGDFDGDGLVKFQDFVLLTSNFGFDGTTTNAAPEVICPASWVVSTLLAWLQLRRSRQKPLVICKRIEMRQDDE